MEKIEVPVAIGTVVVAFSIDRRAFAAKVIARYKGYLRQRPVRGRCLRVVCSFSGKKLSPNERISVTQTKNSGWRARRYDIDCSWNGTEGRAVLWPSLYSFDACLRVLCATQLLRNGGLLLHGSGVIYRDRAFIFLGPSGSGKTTIARLSAPKRILSDEIVALTIDGKKRVRAFGTPFWGEMGTGPASKKSYAVHSLNFLKKSDRFCRLTIEKEKTVQKLLRCVCLFSRSAEESGRALELCIEIIAATSPRILCFEKKPPRWEVLRGK